MQVRWANINDVALAVPLFDAYRGFYGNPSDLGFCAAFLTERLSKNESKVALAIDASGHAVGFMQLYPMFSSSALTLEKSRIWVLNDLFVAPAARKMGVGEALLNFAQDFARETGVGYLMLETAKTNLTAQSLYEKQGWIRDNEYLVYSWRAAN